MNQSDIEIMIHHYTDAEVAVLAGKVVTLNGQSMTMENLSGIREGRKEWERRLANHLKQCRGQASYRIARF